MKDVTGDLAELSERSRTILRQIVETYLETGEPVGSRNLSRVLPMTLSPASIRNVMSDLEQLGLIAAPHTSAGRLPTQLGLRLFVDGLLEIGDLAAKERRQIESHIAGKHGTSVDAVLKQASELISGLSHCAPASAPKTRAPKNCPACGLASIIDRSFGGVAGTRPDGVTRESGVVVLGVAF